MTEWTTLESDFAKTTWLKIALLKKGDAAVQGPVFNANAIKLLPTSSFLGLRADHVPLISTVDIKLFNESITPFLSNDTLSAVTAQQLVEISGNAFGFITPFGVSGITPVAIRAITDDQIHYLSTSQIRAWNCEQLKGFSIEQLNQFNAYQQAAFTSQVSL